MWAPSSWAAASLLLKLALLLSKDSTRSLHHHTACSHHHSLSTPLQARFSSSNLLIHEDQNAADNALLSYMLTTLSFVSMSQLAQILDGTTAVLL